MGPAGADTNRATGQRSREIERHAGRTTAAAAAAATARVCFLANSPGRRARPRACTTDYCHGCCARLLISSPTLVRARSRRANPQFLPSRTRPLHFHSSSLSLFLFCFTSFAFRPGLLPLFLQNCFIASGGRFRICLSSRRFLTPSPTTSARLNRWRPTFPTISKSPALDLRPARGRPASQASFALGAPSAALHTTFHSTLF